MKGPGWAFGVVALLLVCVPARGQQPGRPLPAITIDKERMCPLVDGKPFFAIGCCGIPGMYMKEAADAGLNLTVRWGCYQHREFKQAMDHGDDAVKAFVCGYLDAAKEPGLWVMDWPAVFGGVAVGGDVAKWPDYLATTFPQERLPLVVAAEKDHPALLGYFLVD